MAHGADYGAGDQTLVKAAQEVGTAKQQFDKNSNDLANELSNMNVKWQGEGGTAFFNLHNKWVEKQKLINKVLDDFADSLVQTDKTNKSNDAEQNASIAKIAAILDN